MRFKRYIIMLDFTKAKHFIILFFFAHFKFTKLF